MLKIEINSAIADARLKHMPQAVRDALKEKERELAGMVVARARGAAPKKTGQLASGIISRVSDSKKWVVARVWVKGKARRYAHAQEHGARTTAHEILPNKAKALAFALGGKTVFAGSVKSPGATIPPHSFLRSSLKTMAGDIKAGMVAAVKFGLSKAE